MKSDDARKLDHAALEALRMRSVRSVQDGENPDDAARALRITPRAMYLWLALYRRGGWNSLKAKKLAGDRQAGRRQVTVNVIYGDTKKPAAIEVSILALDA